MFFPLPLHSRSARCLESAALIHNQTTIGRSSGVPKAAKVRPKGGHPDGRGAEVRGPAALWTCHPHRIVHDAMAFCSLRGRTGSWSASGKEEKCF